MASGALPPFSDELVRHLQEKHPVGPKTPFGNTIGPRSAAISRIELTYALRGQDPEGGTGPAGWTKTLLMLAYDDEGFGDGFSQLANQIAAGTAVGHRYLTASMLIPLQTGQKVRPIAVQELMLRVIKKAMVLQFVTPDGLHQNQRASRPGGCGTSHLWLESAEREVSEGEEDRYLLDVDQSNGFNNLSRKYSMGPAVKKGCPKIYRCVKWGYNTPSLLILLNGTDTPTLLWSKEGGLQGDPMMLYIYGLAWRPVLEHTLENIIDKDTDDGMSIVDDTKYLVNDEDTANKILDYLDTAAVKKLGFFLNRDKTKITKLSDINKTGGEVYGMHIGPPLDKKREWLDAKAVAPKSTCSSRRSSD